MCIRDRVKVDPLGLSAFTIYSDASGQLHLVSSGAPVPSEWVPVGTASRFTGGEEDDCSNLPPKGPGEGCGLYPPGTEAAQFIGGSFMNILLKPIFGPSMNLCHASATATFYPECMCNNAGGGKIANCLRAKLQCNFAKHGASALTTEAHQKDLLECQEETNAGVADVVNFLGGFLVGASACAVPGKGPKVSVTCYGFTQELSLSLVTDILGFINSLY